MMMVISDLEPTDFFQRELSNSQASFFFFLLINNAATAVKSLQSCPTLCDPMDGRPPGSSVHRTLQARILEWVAISFSLTNLDVNNDNIVNYKYIIKERRRVNVSNSLSCVQPFVTP